MKITVLQCYTILCAQNGRRKSFQFKTFLLIASLNIKVLIFGILDRKTIVAEAFPQMWRIYHC